MPYAGDPEPPHRWRPTTWAGWSPTSAGTKTRWVAPIAAAAIGGQVGVARAGLVPVDLLEPQDVGVQTPDRRPEPLLVESGRATRAAAEDVERGDPHAVQTTTARRRQSEQHGIPREVQRPALVTLDAFADRLPAGAVAVEVAVLELDQRALRAVRDEPDLDLAGEVRGRSRAASAG